MPITPYALNVKGVDFGQSLNALNAVRQMQAARQQQEMNALAMQKAQREEQSAQAFKNALATGAYKTPEGMNTLMGIDPNAAIAVQKNMEEMKKAQAETIKDAMELFPKALGRFPDSKQNYQFVYSNAIKEHPELANYFPHPDQYEQGKTYNQIVLGPKGYADLNKPMTVGKGGSVYIPGQGFQQAPGVPDQEKPFSVGEGFVYDPNTKSFISAPTKKKEITDWKEQVDENGNLIYFSPSTNTTVSSTGFPVKGTGKTATTSAQAAKEEAAQAAIQNLGTIFNRVEEVYGNLEKEGAITDPSKGALYNVQAYLKSSGPGRTVGQIVGSKAQQARNELENLSTTFMTQISKATGLTSQQLNSNLEFSTFKKLIEASDVKTARNQIALLKEMFGKKIPSNTKEVTQTFGAINRQVKEGKQAAEQPEETTQGTQMPKVGTVEDGHRFKGGNPADPANWEEVR